MPIYIAPFLVFFILSIASFFLRKSSIKILMLPIVIACIFFVGFRQDADFDYSSYLEIFNSIPPLSQGWSNVQQASSDLYLESSFTIIVSILKIFFSDTFIFVIIASLSLLLYNRSFAQATAYPALAFLVYVSDGFYLREFTQIRFGAAVSIGLASLIALKYKKNIKHFLLILCACFFHYTSFILFISAIWINIIKTRKNIIFTSTFAIILALLGVFDNFVYLLSDLNIIPSRLSAYLGTEHGGIVSAEKLLIPYVILLWSTSFIDENDVNFFWVKIYFLSLILLIIFSGFDLMRRLSFFFSISICIITSVALEKRKGWFLLFMTIYSSFLINSRFDILYDYKNWIFD